MNLQNMSKEEQKQLYNYAKQKSFTKEDSEIAVVDYHGKKKKYDFGLIKKVTIAASAVVVAAAIGVGVVISNVVDKVSEDSKDNQIIEMVLDEYEDIVNSETKRTQNNDGYWYDSWGIANQVLESENPTLALYTVYKDIEKGWAPHQNMDDVVQKVGTLVSADKEKYEAKGIQAYDSFDSYLIGIGCTDKDGKASTKEYDEKLRDYALQIGIAKQAQSQVENMESGMKR